MDGNPTFLEAIRLEEIPQGQGRRVDLEGTPVAIFNVRGRIHAIEDTCPHQGGSLGKGRLRGTTVACPLHLWKFNVTTGENDLDPRLKVRSFPVKVVGGAILVGI